MTKRRVIIVINLPFRLNTNLLRMLSLRLRIQSATLSQMQFNGNRGRLRRCTKWTWLIRKDNMIITWLTKRGTFRKKLRVWRVNLSSNLS